jgi:hypothetical protein
MTGHHPIRMNPARAQPVRPTPRPLLLPEIRRQRRLRLEAEQVLDRRGHGTVHAPQEQLPLQQRAVELAGTEDARHVSA